MSCFGFLFRYVAAEGVGLECDGSAAEGGAIGCGVDVIGRCGGGVDELSPVQVHDRWRRDELLRARARVEHDQHGAGCRVGEAAGAEDAREA